MTAFVLVGVGLVGGCKPKLASKLVGRYMSMSKPPAATGPAIAGQPVEPLGTTSTLELRKDGTYSMTLATMPMEGTWAVDGSTVVLTMQKFLGHSMDELRKEGSLPNTNGLDKPLRFTASEAGDTLTRVSDPAANQGDIVFTKSKS